MTPTESKLATLEKGESGFDDDFSGHEEESETGHGTNDHNKARKKQEEEERKALLKRKEEKAVFLLRIAVYTTVLITAILVCVGVYYLTKRQEQDAFETAFYSNAQKLAETFVDSVGRKIVAVGSLSTSITATALATKQTFPNVTIENWVELSIQTRIQADGMVVEYAPLVTDQTRLGWEEYANQSRFWMRDAYYQEKALKIAQNEKYGLEDPWVGPPTWEPCPFAEDSNSTTSNTTMPVGNFTLPEDKEQKTSGAPAAVQEEGPQEEEGGEQDSPPARRRLLKKGVKGKRKLQGPGGPEAADHPGTKKACKGPRPYVEKIFKLEEDRERDWSEYFTVRPEGSGIYAPFWQMTPIIPREFLLNNDLMLTAGAKDSFQRVIQTNMAAIGPAVGVEDPTNITDFDLAVLLKYHDYLGHGQYRYISDYYGGDPSSGLAYPVFDSFNLQNRSLAGFLHMPLVWKLNYERVLPETMDGFIVVMKSSSDQAFSYRVDGPVVTYLGFQDFHSPEYNDMFVFENVGQSIGANLGPDSETFDAVEVDWSFQEYVAYIYPSDTLKDHYITNQPVYYTLAVAGIFLFTLMVLATFDFLVARRQSIMMQKAVESRALISTLYPEQVRDRLLDGSKELKKTQAEEEKRRKQWQAVPETISETKSSSGNRDVIAQLYPDSSVLLMDLAGFTKWSSTRTPADVFLLLETLYQSFDRIAIKRGVYKIETIGDCWVGVTGVPNPQDDHAVRMCKFAAQCQVKMDQLCLQMKDELGDDTADLGLRVGIHSGPITGGILRGDRGRFQLFGDTINTASRMESNGLPGKIQVSQSTADELLRHNRGEWLTVREDKVVAKGKGEMTTYWVHIRTARTSQSSETMSSVTISTFRNLGNLGIPEHAPQSMATAAEPPRDLYAEPPRDRVAETPQERLPMGMDAELEI